MSKVKLNVKITLYKTPGGKSVVVAPAGIS